RGCALHPGGASTGLRAVVRRPVGCAALLGGDPAPDGWARVEQAMAALLVRPLCRARAARRRLAATPRLGGRAGRLVVCAERDPLPARAADWRSLLPGKEVGALPLVHPRLYAEKTGPAPEEPPRARWLGRSLRPRR